MGHCGQASFGPKTGRRAGFSPGRRAVPQKGGTPGARFREGGWRGRVETFRPKRRFPDGGSSPFNALLPILGLNNALVARLRTGAEGFITAADYVGPHAG
jgi:hypothetical protein